MHAFLSNRANTDRQTDRQTNKHGQNMYVLFLSEVIKIVSLKKRKMGLNRNVLGNKDMLEPVPNW